MSLARKAAQYLGVRAVNPPDLLKVTRASTTSDTKYEIGTLWIDTATADVYMHSGAGVWVPMGEGSGTITAQGDITSVAGDIIIQGAGKQLQVEGGAATDFIGQATLVSGTVDVLNTNIAAADRIFLTRSDVNSSSALGVLGAVIDVGVKFTINSLDLTASVETGDVSIIDYFIVRQL